MAAVLIASGTAIPASATTVVNVRDYGARGDGSVNDTAAVQRANDAVAPTGGRVYFPSGMYLVGGVIQDSNVEFYGTGGAVLKHPNGTYPMSIVRTRMSSTTGTIAAGSSVLQVASTYRIKPGVTLAIRGAGPSVSGQSTSTPVLYAHVQAIAGRTVQLSSPAVGTVYDATVYIGTVNAAIRGLVLDGNKPSPGSSDRITMPVELNLARGAIVANNVIRNGKHGGISMDYGTNASFVESNTMWYNGTPERRLGAAIWMFRGTSGNTVRNNSIGGSTYWGIVMDDRTQTASDFDAPATNNVVDRNTIHAPPMDWNVGILVIGSSSNTITNNTVRDVQTSIAVDESKQGTNARDSRSNIVSGNALTAGTVGIHVSGSSNSFSTNTISAKWRTIVNEGSGNSFS